MKDSKRLASIIEEIKDQFEIILEEMKILEDFIEDLQEESGYQ